MAVWARYSDGLEVDEAIIRTHSKFAVTGTLDVFASDQHSSYKKLLGQFFKHIGQEREAGDDDVREVCTRFARVLAEAEPSAKPSATLFNHVVYMSEGLRDTLGGDILLIGRLEDTNPIDVDGKSGRIAHLAKEVGSPEAVADKVDAFKTLVYLNPDHRESWEENKEWLANVFETCQKLRKALYNETLLHTPPDRSKAEHARRLPEALVKIAEEFSPLGHFYKTQVPVLWTEEDSTLTKICSPKVIRETAEEIARVSPRPLLLLSAAVDFEQYSAQYGIVCDLFAGPMCGRAYFKEAFTDPHTKDWDSLEESFRRIALPRIEQIKGLASVVSQPWWHKFHWIADEARALLKPTQSKPAPGVKADFGY